MNNGTLINTLRRLNGATVMKASFVRDCVDQDWYVLVDLKTDRGLYNLSTDVKSQTLFGQENDYPFFTCRRVGETCSYDEEIFVGRRIEAIEIVHDIYYRGARKVDCIRGVHLAMGDKSMTFVMDLLLLDEIRYIPDAPDWKLQIGRFNNFGFQKVRTRREYTALYQS